MDAPDLPQTPIFAMVTAALLGVTWAAARADDVATVVQTTGAALPSIPQGLDGLTFPAALVLLAWSLKGWTPTVRHVHEIDPATRRSMERIARIHAGKDVTDHGEGA